MVLLIFNIFSINLNYINYETVCILLILPIMFLISCSCSDDTVEEMCGSNHVLFARYLQEVINISMDNPERVRLVVQEFGTVTLPVIGTVSGTALDGWSGALVGVAIFCQNMKKSTLIMIFCLSTFIIIPLLIDLFEQEYYTKCFVIVFSFMLSVKGLCKKIVQKS